MRRRKEHRTTAFSVPKHGEGRTRTKNLEQNITTTTTTTSLFVFFSLTVCRTADDEGCNCTDHVDNLPWKTSLVQSSCRFCRLEAGKHYVCLLCRSSCFLLIFIIFNNPLNDDDNERLSRVCRVSNI